MQRHILLLVAEAIAIVHLCKQIRSTNMDVKATHNLKEVY